MKHLRLISQSADPDISLMSQPVEVVRQPDPYAARPSVSTDITWAAETQLARATRALQGVKPPCTFPGLDRSIDAQRQLIHDAQRLLDAMEVLAGERPQ